MERQLTLKHDMYGRGRFHHTTDASACPELPCFVDGLSPRALGSSWEGVPRYSMDCSLESLWSSFSRGTTLSHLALVVFAYDNGCLCVLHSATMHIVCCSCHQIFSSMAGSVHDLLCRFGQRGFSSARSDTPHILMPLFHIYTLTSKMPSKMHGEKMRKRTHFVLHGVLDPKYI